MYEKLTQKRKKVMILGLSTANSAFHPVGVGK